MPAIKVNGCTGYIHDLVPVVRESGDFSLDAVYDEVTERLRMGKVLWEHNFTFDLDTQYGDFFLTARVGTQHSIHSNKCTMIN